MAYTQTNFLGDSTRVNYVINTAIENKLQHYQLTKLNTLNITGGIPYPFSDIFIHKVDYDQDAGYFFVSTESMTHRVERRIFPQEQYIDNLLMQASVTGQGVGKYIFINEIIEARKLGYRYMTVSAAKATGLNGYYTWARFGYSMEELDHENLLELMEIFRRKETSIIELMNTQDGRDFWLANGFWWEGYFDLADGSENMIAFQHYLAETGIDVSL